MRRQLLCLFALATVLACLPLESASAAGMRGGVGGGGRGFGRGFGGGFGIGYGGGGGYGWDIAALYRELYNNLPYFALHPPVYYSEPVPRPYGYSPFAYPPGTMTPEVVTMAQPVTINNPYVPAGPAPADVKPADRSAAVDQAPEPLVITNPYVSPASSVAAGR